LIFWNKKCQKYLGIPDNGKDIKKTGFYSVFGKRKKIKCKLEIIDEWCEDNIYPDLIKIDAEGSEYRILSSGIKCLKKCKYIVYENNPYFKETKKIPKLLKSIGFHNINKLNESWNLFFEKG